MKEFADRLTMLAVELATAADEFSLPGLRSCATKLSEIAAEIKRGLK